MFRLLEMFGVATEGYDRWDTVWLGAGSIVNWALLVALLVATLAWTRSSVTELRSGPRRALVGSIQALAALAVALVLLQPAIRLAKVAKIKDRVAFLVDTSESMSLPGGDPELTRADEAFRFVSENSSALGRLEDEFVVDYLGFAEEVSELGGRPMSASSDGPRTDILSALSELGSGGAPLAGVVIISDGTDTARLARRKTEDIEKIKEFFRDYGAPVNTVALGSRDGISDLSIVKVSHDDYGFVHNPFEVEVTIKSEGDLATHIPVTFKQGNDLLATKNVAVDPETGIARTTLSFTPRQVGEFMFSVEVPVLEGEVTAENNVARFPLKILRDKVRVLFIVGNPSWDERFLRRALKKNPSVDLVSFYILRQHWDDPGAAQSDLSLIEFPTKRLFTEELENFDLLIWQNFRGPPYMYANYPFYMANLNRYVRERGGSLLMIGGRRGFLGAGRLDPKLLDLLPVEPIEEAPNYKKGGEFHVEPTPAGMRHPIMDVAEPGASLAEAWSNMPAIEGYNRVLASKPGALTLAVHPFESGRGGKLPLVSVWEAGAGRVMAVMTDESWKWNFLAAGEGKSNKPYQRFWENSVRWLLRDPELRLISVSADKSRPAPGDEVTIVIETLDESYSPTNDAELSVELAEAPEGHGIELPEPERFSRGKYKIALRPEAAGAYRVRASATLGARSLGRDDAIFEVTRSSVEWTDVMPRPGLLAAISEATGGAALSADGDADDFAFRPVNEEQVIGSADVPLWDNWAVFGFIFALMTSGWYLRRRWGLK